MSPVSTIADSINSFRSPFMQMLMQGEAVPLRESEQAGAAHHGTSGVEKGACEAERRKEKEDIKGDYCQKCLLKVCLRKGDR